MLKNLTGRAWSQPERTGTTARVRCVCANEPPAVLAADLLHQQRHDRLEVIVGQLLQLIIGAILHRMLHEHICRIGAKRLRLSGGGFDEFGRRDTDRRNSVGLEIRQVMRTARRAGASVSQSFDNDVHFADDLLA